MKEEVMNKTELTKAVAEKTGLTQTQATGVVDAVFETIAGSLRKGEQVTLAGFGSFVAKTRAAREGRNPSTGLTIAIPARTSAAFKPASALKDL
ncbi:MAG: HU family DNA-binding protein [Alphaproteobacteria bacterium]|nr:HU family DNA-binding protein [Alphaproteobacteria bacterium]